MRKSQSVQLHLAAAFLVGLGFPAGVSAAAPRSLALATTSPQVTHVSIPSGSGTDTSSLGFSPDQVVVVIGVNNTVTWTDNDNHPDIEDYVPNHVVAANDNSFTSASLSVGDTFTYTFTTPGTYQYHCNVHAWMKGAVVVKGTAAPVPEFPLPYVVLLVTLGVTAVASTLARGGPGGLLNSKVP
jgi:plastocyanin